MKRARDGTDDAAAASSSSRAAPPKKPKSIQACISCRKHKTRCEILDPSKTPIRCHRCQVLALQCSYEDTMTPITASANISPNAAYRNEMPDPPVSTFKAHMSVLPPTDRLWSFVDDVTGVDWSAPMLAIQQLSKLPFAHLSLPPPPPLVLPQGELTLATILPEDQVFSLLNLFDERYTPWLNFKPARSPSSTMLDLVCCTIAARHLENTPASIQTKMLLQKLTDDSMGRIIMNPRPYESVESIQALLILSLWAPLGGPVDSEGRDGRLLVASAVSMAMNLRLNQASQKVATLRKRAASVALSAEDQSKLAEALENTRLWISLTNTESMLCVGTGRVPLSRRSPEDLKLVEFPSVFDDSVDYRDVRLGLTASAFDLLEEAANNRLQPGMDVDEWYDQIMILLEKMKRVKRLMGPMPFVLEREPFYFHMLKIYEATSRLLILYNAMWDARVSVGHIPHGDSWHTYFKPHGMEAIGEWGRDMVITTEALLTNILTADSRLLSTAPDNIFTMVALTSGYLVGVKFLMMRGGTELIGTSDLLLAKMVSHLGRAVCGPGHAAQRTALLVRGMIAKWEGRNNPPKAPPPRPPPPAASSSSRANASTSSYSTAGVSPSASIHSPSSSGGPSGSVPHTPNLSSSGSASGSSVSYPTPRSDSPNTSTTSLLGASTGTTPNPGPTTDYMELSAFNDPHQQPNHYLQSPIPDIDFGMFMDSMSIDPEFWNNLAQQSHLEP
ncbi:hypothetical protein HMN09_00289700 [Mycena chlorophos]|uniref:Zn(2)-C6 fungal-type domain-containing protein n=1 Tax=Mycena chlorophos TaxID=658473 RepID=A0A8H6TLL8_MYCCL|nr:hypothetical protein HMN09_00289700 [Mycena chlorophos]